MSPYGSYLPREEQGSVHVQAAGAQVYQPGYQNISTNPQQRQVRLQPASLRKPPHLDR